MRPTSRISPCGPSGPLPAMDPKVLLVLLRVGFAEPPQSPAVLVVSYTAVSPLPVRRPAVCSLWHYPAGRPGWVLPTTLPCGVRTFLDNWRLPRSPGRLVRRPPRVAAAARVASRAHPAAAQRGQDARCTRSPSRPGHVVLYLADRHTAGGRGQPGPPRKGPRSHGSAGPRYLGQAARVTPPRRRPGGEPHGSSRGDLLGRAVRRPGVQHRWHS